MISVLSGKVPENYSLADDRNKQKVKYSSTVVEEWERKVHSLLIFVPVGILGTKDLLLRIKQNFVYATKVNLTPLVIVTKLDTIPDLEEQAELKVVLARELGVPENRLFLIKNYTDETEKNFDIDKSSLQILKTALEGAESFLTYHLAPQASKLRLDDNSPSPSGGYPSPSDGYSSPSGAYPSPGIKPVGERVGDLICSKCGIAGTGKFCNECGGVVVPKPVGKSCGSCHCPVTGKFCNNCGASVAVTNCPVCGSPSEGKKFCNNCGHKF